MYGGGFFIYFLWKRRYRHALLLILFPVLSQLLFLWYLYHAYGNFSPTSVYMNEGQKQNFMYVVSKIITLKMRIETLLNYFFDQRDGLLFYNPIYFFAFPGLVLTLKRFRKYLPHLLIAAPGVIFVLSYAFLTHRGGFSPQARPLLPVTWLLMLFALIYYSESGNRLMKRIFLYLPLYPLFVTAFQLLHPRTLYQATTSDNKFRPGLMFQTWSSIHVNIADILPSFVKIEGNHTYLPNIIWLLVFLGLIIFALVKLQRRKIGGAAITIAFILLFAIFSLFPRIPTYNPVLVTQSGNIPYKIYRAALQPQKMARRPYFTSRPGGYLNTLSSWKRMKNLAIRLKNSGPARLRVNLTHFDHMEAQRDLEPGENGVVLLKNPRAKPFRNEFYYRIMVEIKPLKRGDISCSFEFFPCNRCPASQ
jgi:hypothetical protein